MRDALIEYIEIIHSNIEKYKSDAESLEDDNPKKKELEIRVEIMTNLEKDLIAISEIK